jgi:hypothetical protein
MAVLYIPAGKKELRPHSESQGMKYLGLEREGKEGKEGEERRRQRGENRRGEEHWPGLDSRSSGFKPSLPHPSTRRSLL